MVQVLLETADKVNAKSPEVIQNQPATLKTPPAKIAARPTLSSDRPKPKKAVQKAPSPEINSKTTITAKVVEGLKMTELPVEMGLKNSRSVSVTPRGNIASEKSEDTMDILSFTFKGNVRRFKVHLPEGWVKVEHPEERQLWMRSGTKKQIELNAGDNIMVNQATDKIFVVTVIAPSKT